MDKVIVYTAKDGIRWHRKSENGLIVSESGQGYENKGHAIHMATEVNGGEYVIEDETDK